MGAINSKTTSGYRVSTAYCPAYFGTVFFGDPIPAGWLKNFAVVTGYAPTGETWTDARNLLADQALRRRLRRWQPLRVTGRSTDGQHAEPGWLVPCSKVTAVKIGREFQQDAIFWIQNDHLQVVGTSQQNRRPQSAGRFRAKYSFQRRRSATLEATSPLRHRVVLIKIGRK